MDGMTDFRIDLLPAVTEEGVLPDTTRRVTVLRLDGGTGISAEDMVVEEVPVAMAYNGIVHAVMLATPRDLEDMALGFSLSENIIATADELYEVAVVTGCDGVEVRMDIPLDRFMKLKGQRRSLAGRTGCGVCGVESLQAMARAGRPVSGGTPITPAAVARALRLFGEEQALHRLTGAVHGVAWAAADGTIVALREDVGRHNALDKLIGWLVSTGVDPASGFALTSSRASYEMVQKASRAGIGCLVAISAPTGLAVRMAEASGLTLAGFARGNRLAVYTHGERLAV
ncbi:FdhD protein/phenylacetyl-CoA:acceptor oxidoreductase accessory protein [Azospirillum fermentarium]|uniref:formate dehydrogenase accessory sulfurtransferase FdhD n=1 Tax=Azospirillum fermentarium TaxID=1233114 RepID=UPI0022277981|nr:formate dehydrogenase accessory sulfurtransferase FdhD [Azospirillum fermentarium]MCW2247664.1 FdhD protein/phenylacetyl-CoA:acceptor oxidoreductase accessory protein [Azospirillum fermentarium]